MKKWKLVAIAAGAGLAAVGGLAVTATTATADPYDRTALASSGLADFMTGYSALCTYVGQGGTNDTFGRNGGTAAGLVGCLQ